MKLEDKNTHYTAKQLYDNYHELVKIKVHGTYTVREITVGKFTYYIHVDMWVRNKHILYIDSNTGYRINEINTTPMFTTTRQVYKHLVKELKLLRKTLKKEVDTLSDMGV